jgi:hypothetical protein
MKRLFKNLVGIALPLGLAMGCAENRPHAQAVYGPPPNVVLQQTSAEPEQRIYRETDTTGAPAAAVVNTAPGGASPENWALAEKIREKLISDTTLAPLGSELIANVGKDGVVTLTGSVSSPSEEQRVCDTISSLPGVRGVNNELSVGRRAGSGRVNMQ